MATSKEHYQINPGDLANVISQMNFILARMADRMDKIEGLRGTSTIVDGLSIETNSQVVHGFNTTDET